MDPFNTTLDVFGFKVKAIMNYELPYAIMYVCEKAKFIFVAEKRLCIRHRDITY